MQQRSELPEGWAWTTVGESYTLVGGGTPSTKNQEYWNGSIPWISSADIYGLKDIQPRKFVTKLGVDNSSTNIVPENSIIVVTRVGLGKICLTSYPLCFSQDSQALIGNPSLIFPDYVLYYLSVAVKDFKYNNRGTTISGVPKKQLAEIQIPLPPLPEQHRIVSAIEALFARLDATNEKLDRVLEILKKFRQSVLAVACDGRLTEDWRVKQTESKETYQNEQRIPDGWKSSKIGDIFEYWGGATPSTSDPSYWGGEIPWISSKDMKTWKVANGQKYITQQALEKTNLRKCPINSVLVVVRSGILAHSLPVAITESEVVINQDLKAFYNPDNDLNNWLALYLRGKAPEILFRNRKDGTTVQSIKFDELKNLKLLIPSKEEQQEIVRRVDALFTFADSVEAKVSASREKTEKLRQSILTKAFSGQLVETEAEIARREGRDYETAEVLIERIKKERGKEGKKR